MRVKLESYGIMPERAHDTDAGLDIKSPVRVGVIPGGSAIVKTGIRIELPKGTVGMLKSKSGLNVRDGILSEGVIDEGYTGEIIVKLYNQGSDCVVFDRGDKITQLVILPVVYPELELVNELDNTERGNGGFGSTGR